MTWQAQTQYLLPAIARGDFSAGSQKCKRRKTSIACFLEALLVEKKTS